MSSPSISEAEWSVLQVLWEKSPASAEEVAGRLCELKSWHERTVKTLLHRLVRKGAVSFRVEGKRYLYQPRLSRQKCVRTEGRRFLARVFGGAAAPAVLHFAEEARIEKAEIERLKRLLEVKKGGRR